MLSAASVQASGNPASDAARLIEPENERPYSTSVQEVLEYVNGNYQDSLTLGTFCEQKHYSVGLYQQAV